MKISVIVPVYGQWHLIPKLVDAWSAQTNSLSNELIIIDNGSKSIPYYSSIKNLFILQCKTPGSYAARNRGLEAAKGELVVFTDADCIPEHNWLNALFSAYELSDRNTIFAGKVVINSHSVRNTTAELYDISVGLPQQRYVSKGYAVTANLAVPRKVFDHIGKFDATRFSGGDADFCQRAVKAGAMLQFVSDAVVYHPARKTWLEYATKIRRVKGGQIRAGSLPRRFKYLLITFIPPVWRLWRIAKSDKLTVPQKFRVLGFQTRLWGVELLEVCALLAGKTPERR